MKAKKASKRLVKVEELLVEVIDRYSANDNVVHGLLDSASASVASARQKLDGASAKKPPAKSGKTRAKAKTA